MTEATEKLQTSKHHIGNSASLLFAKLIGGILILEILFGALVLASSLPAADAYYTFIVRLLTVFQLLKIIIEIGFVITIILPWASVNFYISDNQLIRYAGLPNRDESVFELTMLKGLELHQSWFAKLVNAGDLKLNFASSGFAEEVWLLGIHDPKKYERILREKLHQIE